ncbi:FAD-dependent monooxygenase [Actinomadura sediminis]|uniref:FAD-dependent monooxygenase n=1 Tax=Actinomadura sediminis TaxID=1038904 RepID=A0ABW3EWI0_9ACTN
MSDRPGTPVPVLISGGGVTGLACAAFLARRGVPCMLVERHPGLLAHPRARGLTPRTMEIFRGLGIEGALRDAAFAGADYAWTPVMAETLNDDEYGSSDEPSEDVGTDASPAPFGHVDQDRVEEILRDRAGELGARIRYGVELASFEQDADGVTARLVDRATGTAEIVRAGYLVAADGFHSPVRGALGVELDGPGTLFHTITAIVDADLTPATRGRAIGTAYLQRPLPFTIMMPHGTDGRRWVFGTGYDPADRSPADFTDAEIAGMVRAAAGLPDVAVTPRPQIPGTDLKVLGFPIGAQIARRFRTGRVFLAGDAAHAWPPTGGLGANAGVQDAHNLAWKLAEVHAGRAGDALLDTYEAERRATGLLTMEQAMARFGSRMGPGDGPEIIDYGAVSMGYRYRSSAIIESGAPEPPAEPPAPLRPARLDGRPGARAPHVDLGGGRSTLDLYGDGFVLLAGRDTTGWTALEEPGVTVHRFGDGELKGADESSHGIGTRGALLVRPDGFVAWRGADAAPAAVAAAVRAIRGAS